MDIRQLRHVVAVAEERSFTRAAERLHISQPGLSRSVRDLERQLGVEIFDRSGRQIELTAAGRRTVIEARRAVLAFDTAVQEIRGLAGRLRGPARVGVSVDTWSHATLVVER